MQLILIRHGVAVERDEWHLDDFLRPLTPKGEEKTRAALRGIARVCDAPDLLASSPKTRALQTANILHEFWKQVPLEVWPELGGDDFDPWLAKIGSCSAASLCLVGHEPHLSRFTSLLLSGNADRSDILWKKAGALALEVDGTQKRGQLLWMLPPRILRVVGEK